MLSQTILNSLASNNNEDSLFSSIYTDLNSDKYLLFPIFRVDYIKDPQKYNSRYNAEHILGLFYMEFNSDEFNGNEEIISKRLGNLSRNLSILFDKILFQRRYDQIEILKNSLYKLPISNSEAFYKQVVNVVKEIMKCEICSLFIKLRNTKSLQLVATTAEKVLINRKTKENSTDFINKEIYKNSFQRSFTFNVAENTNVCLNYDESDINSYSDHVFLEESEQLTLSGVFYHKSYLAVPLVNNENGTVIGVLRCINKFEEGNLFNTFTQSDSEFLLLLSGIMTRFIDFVLWNYSKVKDVELFSHDFRIPLNELSSGNLGVKFALQKKNFYEANNFAERQSNLINMLEAQTLNFVGSFFESDSSPNNSLSQIKPALTNISKDLRSVAEVAEVSWRQNTNRLILVHDKHLENKLLYIDKRNMYRVFLNLFKNAVRYSSTGILAKDIEVYYNRENVYFEGSNINEWETFEFLNWGIGIRETETESIFVKGFRGIDAEAHSKDGTGLGLFTVSEIIKGHHGKVLVTRCHNPTIIKIYIPVYEQSPLNNSKR